MAKPKSTAQKVDAAYKRILKCHAAGLDVSDPEKIPSWDQLKASDAGAPKGATKRDVEHLSSDIRLVRRWMGKIPGVDDE